MGLLDDAIREHLDLKRRRGADPADVERAEREALGPVRRVAEEADGGELEFAPPPGATDGASSTEEPYEFDRQPEDADWPDPIESDPEPPPALAAPGPLSAERLHPASPAPEPLASELLAPDPLGTEPLTPEPALPAGDATTDDEETAPGSLPDRPESEAPGRRPDPDSPAPSRRDAIYDRAGQETVEYDVEDAIESERDPDEVRDEDVLEETPEFLQDTPDHDRLWFEQKPPRDFDFDG